jgi:magnesium-protoporphyrin IX monomethyl ester (oxidative) cyclase
MYQITNEKADITEPVVASAEESTAVAAQDAALNPRFYTTDFDEMNKLDFSLLREQWDSLVAEFKSDPNRQHFKRTPEFDADFSAMPPKLRQEFIDFLISSVTAEFSGCILYAEIKKRCKNPDVRELFGYMSRDEGRHAGFINHTLNDFDVRVDLSFLTRAKKYTFFKPKFIYYATYLSEKIGYARYITIYRNFEKQPDKRFHPIFKWFDNWCNDEFRHGEAFAVLMRANPETLEGYNKLIIRFFLLAVFCTMYVRDHLRAPFFANMGLDVDDFDRRVIKLTSLISKQVFPVSIDLESPKIWALFEKMYQLTVAISETEKMGGIGAALRRIGLQATVAVTFVRLFLQPVEQNVLPANVRLEPVW